ncbi:PilX N-terminal domain-containing pilus assembly protein [Halomonas heilongjiangensis]|uniref:PilX N-terminal domain-containing pilus assembly protein n=1 Tax=Halomonas heilongjiangensis TaxID=1387883 RepID=UPI0014729D74|nr:PilX N-terminal domain-containing pilus assembly protein [Halomonas heilongjiangensis]
MKTQGKQRGAVLVVTLVMLVMALMLGLSSFQSARLEESMSGNYRSSTQALMAAEYGASDNDIYSLQGVGNLDFISTCDSGVDYALPDEWDEDVQIVYDQDQSTSLGYRYSVGCREFDDRLVLLVTGFFGAGNGSRTIEVDFRSELLPAFGQGMLSDSNIRVNGGATLFGDVHANGNVSLDVDASSTSNISASGSASIGDEKYEGEYENVTVTSGADSVEVPSVRDFFDEGGVYDIEESEQFVILSITGSGANQGCNFDGSGDLQGVTYFCPGKLVLSGSFNNATFFADGDVDHNGSSNLSDSESVDVGIFATGNIEFNGQNDAYGVFWADGKMTQNGSSIIGGSMVSGGDMTLNGGFTFISNSDIVVDSVPSGIVRNGWRERVVDT